MKTIEEAAKKYSISLNNDDCSLSKKEVDEYAITDFKAGVYFAQRWIPVEEELPPMSEDEDSWCWLDEKEDSDYHLFEDGIQKTSESVLIKGKNYDWSIGWYCAVTNEWSSDDINHLRDSKEDYPTHWRPINLK